MCQQLNTINAKFGVLQQNHTWQDHRQFENVSSSSQLRIIRLDEIFYAVPISISSLVTRQKVKMFHIEDAERTLYWNSFFGYISAPYYLINAKFGVIAKIETY